VDDPPCGGEYVLVSLRGDDLRGWILEDDSRDIKVAGAKRSLVQPGGAKTQVVATRADPILALMATLLSSFTRRRPFPVLLSLHR